MSFKTKDVLDIFCHITSEDIEKIKSDTRVTASGKNSVVVDVFPKCKVDNTKAFEMDMNTGYWVIVNNEGTCILNLNQFVTEKQAQEFFEHAGDVRSSVCYKFILNIDPMQNYQMIRIYNT